MLLCFKRTPLKSIEGG